MATEQQFTLQLNFTTQLIDLIKALINFEGIYSSIGQLKPTKVIQTKASQKIANDKRLNTHPLSQLAESLWKHVEFIRVLVPTYEVERIPLKIDESTYHDVITKMLELSIAKSSDSCMYAKKMDDKDIKCEDILIGTYTDLQLTDRLNALGDLTNITGSGRDKNETTLSNLIKYLDLADFESEKNPDVDTVQFYFIYDIRVSMNDVLTSFIKCVTHLYNIANTVELQLRPLFITSTDGGNTQNALTIANDALRRLFAGDLLQEKFSALRDHLKKITLFDSLSVSVKDETSAYLGMSENSLTIALASCDKWHRNLENRFPKLTTRETDENMSSMISILINFKTQILAFKRIAGALTTKISEMFKAAETLKLTIDDASKKPTEKETRAERRSGSTTSPPRGLSLFGGSSSTPTPPPSAVPPQRPPSRPDTSPHPGRSTSAAATSSEQAQASAPSKKSGSQIGRHQSNPGPVLSSSSPQLTPLTPAPSPPPSTLGGK